MERFGFFHDPELNYPNIQMAPSSIYAEGKLLDADDAIDIGRVAIGQERLLVTPIQIGGGRGGDRQRRHADEAGSVTVRTAANENPRSRRRWSPPRRRARSPR